jgi:hypothetical protein
VLDARSQSPLYREEQKEQEQDGNGIMRDGRDLAEDEKGDDDGRFQSLLTVECESNESAPKKSESRSSHWLSH